MSGRLSLFQVLEGAQAEASHPRRQVWLSASAGTGKTHVLTARVLRLLLNGAEPESILCLTFTKAGAAEMAERIQGRLASWVRLPDGKLRKELFALSEPNDDQALRRARRLFARVLDAPGGGLRIQTIHAFAQTMLASFPAEAGLTPGFQPLEGAAEAALARATLAELLVEAERGGDLGLVRDIQSLSRRLGEDKAERFLRVSAQSHAALSELGSREAIEPRVRTALDVPLGDVEEHILEQVSDRRFDTACLGRIADANRAWATSRGKERAAIVEAWLAADASERAATLEQLHRVWTRKDGDPLSFAKGQAPQVEQYPADCGDAHAYVDALLGLRKRAALAAELAAALRAGQAYALAYGAAKRAAGAVDFDDLIHAAVALLERPGIGEWIRYKLDRRTDHILVDEGQDTNVPQWTIVRALAEEFFVEEPKPDGVCRTIFSVGDFKQAIFGFQGTDPVAFAAARRYFEGAAAMGEQQVHRLSLDRSFRSTPPILAVVDRLIDQIGQERMGLLDPPEPHVSARKGLPGQVIQWKPVSLEEGVSNDDEGEEGWLDDAARDFATRLARQVRTWLDQPLWLAGRKRPLRPEDVLILVRKRASLASLIVARLHAEGVPVAGVDRLRLDAPLAVRDLMAAIRFVLQPEDDLNLAALLVSPLFGWSQEELYRVGFGRRGTLWHAVLDDPASVGSLDGLNRLLDRADLATPYRFLEDILSGPLDGRRRLMARLGHEARDPIEELLNAALSFERDATPTLQRFLDWFDRDEVEVTRDPSAPLDAVRVMTVHGAKGLQAPLVILADAPGDPDASRTDVIEWTMEEDGDPLRIFRPRKAELTGTLGDALAHAERCEREEHWRLLYVAVTRAEEMLVIGGALGPRAKGVPPAQSWYAELDRALEILGAEWRDDADWGAVRSYGGAAGAGGVHADPAAKLLRRALPAPPPLPSFIGRPAPQESRPPRPLAPSSLGEDLTADPPPGPAMLAAARRGRLLHALFERLPDLPPDERMRAGDQWLEQAGGVADPAERKALVTEVCGIVAAPAHRDLFDPAGLAEAPIAAVLPDGTVVSGTVDRLVVGDDRILLADFKTGGRVPASAEEAPVHHLRQMAAYVAALAVIFPDRPIDAALLYTSGPTLIPLSPRLLDRHKPGYQDAEQKLGQSG
ncbi:double-strand break repair helicase AddA [uncultured Sphingomonas sp.]|uniref:double-strand break repair helicase AddA n=1 Tax=uncultured Sphingomonas sp. TaxID=158754 RepID=UPI0025EF0AA7|nr:double-strand break repair helicase AddA [uncultured Sphingomonas sp.]